MMSAPPDMRNAAILADGGAANIEALGRAIDSSDDSENLAELQAAWLRRHYPIASDRARVVADLHFGRSA